MSFLSPKTQAPAPVTPAPPAPSRTSDETQALADTQRKRYASMGGRGSTMLTGGLGVSGSSTPGVTSQLLGG